MKQGKWGVAVGNVDY